MARSDNEVTRDGINAVFAALGDADGKRFLSLLTGKPYCYAEMRHLWRDAEFEGMSLEEAIQKIEKQVAATNLPPVGAAFEGNFKIAANG